MTDLESQSLSFKQEITKPVSDQTLHYTLHRAHNLKLGGVRRRLGESVQLVELGLELLVRVLPKEPKKDMTVRLSLQHR